MQSRDNGLCRLNCLQLTPGGQDSAQQRRNIFFLAARKVSSAYVTAELRCPSAWSPAARSHAEGGAPPDGGPRFPTLAGKTEDLCIAIACRHKLSAHTHSLTYAYTYIDHVHCTARNKGTPKPPLVQAAASPPN
jgi:hypothetical protein